MDLCSIPLFFAPAPTSMPFNDATWALQSKKREKETGRQGGESERDRAQRQTKTAQNAKDEDVDNGAPNHPNHPLHHPQPRPLNNAPRSHDTPVSHLLGFRFIGAARKTATRRRQQRHPISMASSSSAFFRLATPGKIINQSWD